MSIPIRSKRANILERLDRGIGVDEITRAEDTSPAYIYNVRSKQRERVPSENTQPSTSTPAAEDLHPQDTAQPGRPPLEFAISATSPVAGIVMDTSPETSLEDPVSDEIRLRMIETRNRLAIARQRLTLARQELQLSIEEGRVSEEWLETRIRQAIIHQCPDAHNLFANLNTYTESMMTILENVEPFRTAYRRIVESHKAHGLDVAYRQDQTDASRLIACLRQSFQFIDTSVMNGHSSGTPLRDHVIQFLRGLVNPDGYCPFDGTPVLSCEPSLGGVCAMDHWWNLSDPWLIRKIIN